MRATFARNASVYVDSWSKRTTPPQIELFAPMAAPRPLL
jgi:hypothetical protein